MRPRILNGNQCIILAERAPSPMKTRINAGGNAPSLPSPPSPA